MSTFFQKFKKQPITISAPMDGTVIPMEKIPDEAFSSGVLGTCLAIEPSDGRVYAPADGKIETIFATKHAMNLLLDSGAELLIHMGLETVELKGKHFSVYKKDGDKIKKGDLLAKMDLDELTKEGYSTITPIVLCNTSSFSQVNPTEKKLVIHEDMLMELKK